MKFAKVCRALVLGVSGMAVSAPAVLAQTDHVAGPYLAARTAGSDYDFAAASDWFLRALRQDPLNVGLIDNSLLSLVNLGDLDRAAPIALEAMSNQVDSQLVYMVALATQAEAGNWRQLSTQLNNGLSVGPRVDALAHGWALVGAGEEEAALAAFDQAAQLPGSRGFGTYHKAMALGVMGRFEEANALLSLPSDVGVPRTRRSVMAHIQILTALGQNDAAYAMIEDTFGRNVDPAILALLQAVDTDGIVPFDIVGSAAEGIAEVFYTEGGAYIESSPPAIVLLYAQIAQHLNPDDAEIIMMSAGLLEELDRHSQAAATYALVRPDNPAYHSAEFGRADALHQNGQTDLAIEVLQNMLRGYPLLAMAHAELGDVLRTQGRWDEANAAYSEALNLIPANDRRHWVLRYKRGISFHQLDMWPQAEQDFRAALALNPNHAGILNYLGYSLVERGENLDEALDMISRAVTAEPDSGAIVDSYGWALYSLGRFQEAVAPMERAAQLLPEDPVINDHLGDVYWAVGRKLEAHFQWNRALSFAKDDEMIAQISDKLENGLEIAMTEDVPGEDDLAQDL